MYGIFVNEDGRVPYAQAIVQGYKPIETRSKDMLRDLVGKRVAVIRTRRGKAPTVLGYVDILAKEFCPADQFDLYREQTLIPPMSEYDVNGKGKWMYHLEQRTCHPLPAAGRRGAPRSVVVRILKGEQA